MTKWNGLARKPLRKVSDKQAILNKKWGEITDTLAASLEYRCQWCGLKGTRDRHYLDSFQWLDGHHIEPRTLYNYTPENCFIVHRVPCHQEITDKNINVALYRNKKMWLATT